MTNHVSYSQTVEKLLAQLMRTPNLNSLRMFDAAARHASFTRAAEELNVTQGAVAQQVRRLEADLGQPLFSRLPRGLSLTPAGTSYHQDIRKALALIDRATQAFSPETQTVTLSVPPSLATKWLVPRLPAFASAHPAISLDLRASEQLTNFDTDAIDLAIRQGPMPKESALRIHPLAPLSLCAVASPRARPIPRIASIRDFLPCDLIEDGHRHWSRLFQTHDLPPPRAALRFNQTALAIDAAISGQGIALAPRLLVQDALASGDLTEIWSAPDTGDSFHILHPERANRTRDTVIQWLESQQLPQR